MKIERTKNKLRIGNLIVSASRWPWQGYGWKATGGPTAPLNTSGARFGGGWRYKLGIQIGGTTVLLDLLFGIVTLKWESAADRAAAARWEIERVALRRRLDEERAAHELDLASIRAARASASSTAAKVDAFGDDIPF